MNAAEILAARIVPLWLDASKGTGDPLVDASTALSRRHLKACGRTLTQFNTGALVVRESQLLALTECQPRVHPDELILAPPVRSRAMVIEDIRRHGPPQLAVIFSKGAIDIHRWACSTADEVVLNGPAGPEETAAMADVALLRTLQGHRREWRQLGLLCARALADLGAATLLHAQAAKLARNLGLSRKRVLELAHHFRNASGLTFDLAAEPSASAA